MSSESFLSLAEIKTIKSIHCLRDLILNLIFLLHCWWNYKWTLSKKNQHKIYLFSLPLLLECWKSRMSVWYFLLHSKKDWARKCSSGQIFAISPLMMIYDKILTVEFFSLVVLFHWFIGTSLSEKSGIFVTTLKSLFSPQILALTSVTCTDSKT